MKLNVDTNMRTRKKYPGDVMAENKKKMEISNKVESYGESS